MPRKPQCPVTSHGGAIRPPRPGAPSCGTRDLQSARSVLVQGRLSDELLALVRGWIELVVRCVTKVWDGIPCGFIERSSTSHPVPPYRSSNLTDWREPHNGSMPIPPPPTPLAGRNHWTMAGRRLSPYRSRASPRRKLQAFKDFARPTAIARTRQASRVLRGDVLHVCHERLAQKPMILNAPTLPRGPSMSRLSRTRF